MPGWRKNWNRLPVVKIATIIRIVKRPPWSFTLARHIMRLAELEGLTAHAEPVRIRLQGGSGEPEAKLDGVVMSR